MSLFDDAFINNVITHLPGLNKAEKIAGMKTIVEGFSAFFANGDRRWLAYMLATTLHETNAQMTPVREDYWFSEAWRKKNLSYYPYYGRGYVQITHQEMYLKAGNEIGIDLSHNPDQALAPDIAAKIMFRGMDAGWFRSDAHGRHSLARYFSADVDDPVGARNIINGKEIKTVGGQQTTVAEIISQYYQIFLHAFTAPTDARPVATTGQALFAQPTEAAGQTLPVAPMEPAVLTPAAPFSRRFADETAILLQLAAPLNLQSAMQTMLDKRAAAYPASHPRYWAIVDFDKKSDVPRLYVFDMEEAQTEAFLCTHGRGSDPNDTGYATEFSNIDGSKMSSLGVCRCAETYHGEHGYSMRLDGLDASNSLIRQRDIVMHPSDYVSAAIAAQNHRIGRSWGCFALDPLYSQSVIDKLKQGSFLMAWKS